MHFRGGHTAVLKPLHAIDMRIDVLHNLRTERPMLCLVQASRLDIAECFSIPVTLVFLPAQDIATYVADGNVDMGITGSDIVQESGKSGNIDTVLQLGFGKCTLCLQAPISAGITEPATLAGKRIATSYPHLTQQYFATFQGGSNTGM